MTIYEQFLKLLDNAIVQFGNATQLARYLNVPTNQITRWKNRERVPQLDTIQPLMDMMQAELVCADMKKSKEVRFVNAYVVDSNFTNTPPSENDYFAAPIVGEVGAGPGMLPEADFKGWFMVHRSILAGRSLHNLIAVEISPSSISMRPTLNPGDIVLVDGDDRDVSRNGNIMLVRDPLDDSGMVKRVSIQEGKRDAKITFYSDNGAQFPPLVYSLMDDFDGDWTKAIAGKVIWAWTDMRDK